MLGSVRDSLLVQLVLDENGSAVGNGQAHLADEVDWLCCQGLHSYGSCLSRLGHALFVSYAVDIDAEDSGAEARRSMPGPHHELALLCLCLVVGQVSHRVLLGHRPQQSSRLELGQLLLF